MAEHTPGPWEYGPRIQATAALFYHDISQVNGQSIAKVWGGGGNRPNKTRTEANARLIAAAPELLEALDGLVDEAESLYDTYGQNQSIEKAKAAIAKAKGQQERG